MFKKIFAIFLFFLWTDSLVIVRSGNTIDSLKILVNYDKEDGNKVIHLNKLGWAFQCIGSYDTAAYYESIALRLAQKINYQEGFVLKKVLQV